MIAISLIMNTLNGFSRKQEKLIFKLFSRKRILFQNIYSLFQTLVRKFEKLLFLKKISSTDSKIGMNIALSSN